MSKLLILNMILKSLVCRGRRRAPAPRVVIVFVDRWTRWDFMGWTWYTECGSEEVLGQGWWTWYRASKWTWSTAGESTEKDGSCPGRRRVSVPLPAKKTGCPGRRRVSVPLVVMVFVVRWTRWDFRGCTRSTHNGSEGVLRPGWWTWYRASKWTWSTIGCQSNRNGRSFCTYIVFVVSKYDKDPLSQRVFTVS